MRMRVERSVSGLVVPQTQCLLLCMHMPSGCRHLPSIVGSASVQGLEGDKIGMLTTVHVVY